MEERTKISAEAECNVSASTPGFVRLK